MIPRTSTGLGVFGAMVHRNDKHGVRGYLDDYWDP